MKAFQNTKQSRIIAAVAAAMVLLAGISFLAYRFQVFGAVKSGQDRNRSQNQALLLEDASTDTSALQVYWFDGSTVKVRTIYDSAAEKELIKHIHGFPLKEADEQALHGLEPPFYGIWISDTKGWDLTLAWSGGVWLKNDGSVYYGDMDFPSIWERMEGDEDTMTVLQFPNAGRLARYNPLFMLKSEQVIPDCADGVSLSVEAAADGTLTARIHNNSREEFTYGEYYSLQKQIDGTWYTLPIMEGNVGFPDIACILPAGESTEKQYNLDIFGPLEPGTYKLVVEGLGAVFTIY